MGRRTIRGCVAGGIVAAFLALFVLIRHGSAGYRGEPVLHIGMTETFIEEDVPAGFDETDAESTCQQLVQEVIGLRSDTIALENQEILAERLASGKLQVGVFRGYEFAWARARHRRRVLIPLRDHSMRVMTANEPYRLEQTIARGSQAFDLGSRNGPYRPESWPQLLDPSCLESWTISDSGRSNATVGRGAATLFR